MTRWFVSAVCATAAALALAACGGGFSDSEAAEQCDSLRASNVGHGCMGPAEYADCVDCYANCGDACAAAAEVCYFSCPNE
jgi:hypothetical protein